ncbi:MAG: ATP-dependent RNA helicase HrpA [Betaproteobacteria bacterium RIFCSPLOWO2_12_FULL_62_58]|nr:MAG: ATP-dependent RNA helicase HrpA [Betaproteobacteria bacterium RIFCSPLOWO2_12_FULL_62_58]
MKFDSEQRLRELPQPTYPDELPVVARREDIAAAISANQVVIVCGETGSGKTTQLPKICLELKRGVAGLIGHTQPRRIAARTVAARIAQELKSPLGHAVGYKVRFSDKLSANTYLKLMTDGILLAETQGDRLLKSYDTLIIDEAHERSLNIDFLLGYVKRLLPRRPDLKLIVASATIDAERFSQHFGGAPVIEVSGRMYPVEVRYRPLSGTLTPAPLPALGEGGVEISLPLAPGKGKEARIDEDAQDIEQAIVDAVDELARIHAGGDVMVFLPGEREIRDSAEALRKHPFDRLRAGTPGAEILPLYARLSFEEQERVFKPGGARRIVLATNVAETSLTVPGIRYVIDTGLARVNRYSYRNKVEQLQVEKVSRASANQRAGRCGRVAAGVCIRLYSEDDYAARPEFTDPEILRCSLAAVILRMKSLKIGDVEDFPFLDPPSPRMIADGYQLLTELGAVDERNNLTPVGWQLAKFPIDPRIARMIVAARQENCLTEVLIIASALSVQDPRDRPYERADAADRAHERFQDERSDFLGYLALWKFFTEALKHKKSNRKLAELLHDNFLSHRRMREWRDIHGQLAAVVGEMGMHANETAASYEQIHRALLAGLLGNIGCKSEEGGEYLGARGIKFTIFPGSVLRKARPRWVMAAELVETTRLYARGAAKIEPEWVEPVAGQLIKKHYFDPHWEKERAMVVAFERVTLYGLTIVPKRRVQYGPINPAEAREIFIRRALAAGDYATSAPFVEHNQKLIKEVQALEHKARRRDVLVDEQTIFTFYNALIPADICNGAAFEKWRREAEQANPRLLFLTRDYLMRHAAADITEAQFPETLRVGDADLKLKYRFDPGHPLDGVSVTVPLHLLNKLEATPFDWLVPGLIREKTAWYLKALPKAIRRRLVPVPGQVTAFLTECERREARGERGEAGGARRETFEAALVDFVQKRAGVPVAADVWDRADVPPHLLMNFRVVDDAGHDLASGRDLAALKAQLGQAAQLTFGEAETGIERDNIRVWDFGDLPEQIAFTRSGRKLTGYPALVDQGESVAIRLFDVRQAADRAMRAGVTRLMRLTLREQMKQLEKSLRGFDQAALQLRGVAGADDLREDLIAAITDRAFIGDDSLPRTQKEFEAQRGRARTRLPAVTEAAGRLFTAIAEEYQRVASRLSGSGGALARIAADIRGQLTRLVCKGFFSATPWEQLAHLPRYLKAMQLRLAKYPNDPERDAKHAASVAELWKRFEERLDKQRKTGAVDPRLEAFRWHIEELRVSLFAQELKTPYPVSYKRLDKIWNAIR